ncbi:hypothetical protein HMPREF1544_07140 [Mucor circinelloides 1006PhL]|uniref:Uncharacterized protein n=1 Tax=Mucor circinelloides f. circinelloides (strain 1006PhL) TaxID=1220926 RepID=S2J8U8_MUCC1|nr:hypothetical protein HMPREF1544_07140 [Mucor circinelloides 1006PhL]
MSAALSFSQTDPVSIPNNNSHDDDERAYKDMIRQLAAQAPEPYGAIPPLARRKDKDKKKRRKKKSKDKKTPIRRMSHVENWLAVDSKESIPDEEDLVHSSPFRNFLSTDFLVLPLHMPPPSLSATISDEEITRPLSPPPAVAATTTHKKDLRPVLFPIKQPPIQVIPIKDSRLIDEEDEDEEEEDGEEEEEEEDDDEEDEEEEEEEDENVEKMLNRKRSIPSFSKSQQPSTSMTKSYAMSTSPPSSSSSSTAVMSTSASSTSSTEQEPSKSRWLETIAQLRRSLTLSNSRQQQQQQQQQQQDCHDPNPPPPTRKSNFIPMPLPPKRNVRKKRRSEATTQPRFNPETNTYTRDTRSNPDHLRMISAELNMMRHRKLSSPLKPRGFLPRRTDAFIRGQQRKLSCLKNEL